MTDLGLNENSRIPLLINCKFSIFVWRLLEICVYLQYKIYDILLGNIIYSCRMNRTLNGKDRHGTLRIEYYCFFRHINYETTVI